MILEKYEEIYKQFIENYKQIHVNPWHEIDEKQLEKIYKKLVKSMDVHNYYSFCYFINYIIKRISGAEDAHTKHANCLPIPLFFKVFGEEAFVNNINGPSHAKLLSISGVDLKTICAQLEEILTYGTEGRRLQQLELALSDKTMLLGLPCLKDVQTLDYELELPSGEKVTKSFDRSTSVSPEDVALYHKNLYGDVASYRFVDNALVYCHSSVQPRFEEKIKQTIASLKKENLSKIDTIIIDLRGNLGGNSALNKPLIDFLKENRNKKLFCLTDYRIFSGGRYALNDLIELGATTVGEDISTPTNCYGNSHHISLGAFPFSISEAYFDPSRHIEVYSKEDFQKLPPDALVPTFSHPDIKVLQTKQDFLAGHDTILNAALKLAQIQKEA